MDGRKKFPGSLTNYIKVFKPPHTMAYIEPVQTSVWSSQRETFSYNLS